MPTLASLRRSPLPLFLAAACAGLLASSCTPAQRLVMVDDAARATPRSQIDLLPVDFYVHLDDTGRVDPRERDRVNAEVTARIESWVRRFLRRRGYDTGNRITWEGASGARGSVPGQEIAYLAEDILEFVNAGDAPEGRGDHRAFIVNDALQVLTSATGSDAVMYVNGKANLETAARRQQKLITAVCCFIASVAFLYLLFESGQSSGSSSGRRVRGRSPRRGPRVRGPRRVRRGPRVPVSVGFHTHWFIRPDPSRPHGGYEMDESGDEELAETTGDRVWLSMTLVDSRDARVLWHVRMSQDLSVDDETMVRETLAEVTRSFPWAAERAPARAMQPKALAPPAPAPAAAPPAPAAPSPAAPAAPAAPVIPPVSAPAPAI